ncbi:MAG TPA: DUF2520 domain-containing protein [Thermoleophilaceae bacterium]
MERTTPNMHSKSDTLAPIGVIGAGRLGGALVDALRQARQPVVGPAGRGEVLDGCRALVLCVPDAEIPAAAAVVAGAAPLIGHTSGASPLVTLTAAQRAGSAIFGWHPLQTFADGLASPGGVRATGSGGGGGVLSGVRAFAGAGCAIAGSSPAALGFARELAETLGMVPFGLAEEDRAAYHAAASIASNFLVTLQAAAERVAAGAGLEPDQARALLAPLIRRTLDNYLAYGPEQALTGPVARGDDATVASQREAVEQSAPELLRLFDELVDQTRRVAGREALA